jgi:hypothetical protein
MNGKQPIKLTGVELIVINQGVSQQLSAFGLLQGAL